MLSRERFLLVLGADAQAWAKRFDLEPFTTPCGSCGEPLTTSQPFAGPEIRGLIAPRCRCGDPRPPYCVVAASAHDDILHVLERSSS